MLIYLIKFSACLAIFMVFYKLLLEKESMHQLKRYYLLAAVVIALSIPFATFTTFVEPPIPTFTEFQSFPVSYIQTEIVEAPIDYTPIILWSLYGLGVVLFGIKFILNLSKIVFKIRKNQKQKTPHFTYVLLSDLITPHTFFSHIFLNKLKFESQQIPKEVFIHEEAHSKQKHSIDVLLIELLQIIFWFNPLIYFLKHAIKMNHEFLADAAVLKQGISPSIYQQLLLAFSSNASEPQLANAINYSSIKKRFTVMKTHTSKQKIWLRSFLLLPLIALTLYGFSERKEVVKEKISTQSQNITPILTVQQEPLILKLNGKETTLETLKNDFVIATNGKKSDLRIETDELLKMSFLDTLSVILKSNMSQIYFTSELGIADDRPFDNKEIPTIIEESKPLLVLSNTVKVVCENCTMDQNLLKNASIATSNNEVVINFKAKFPGKATLYVEGNAFNKDVMKQIELSRNDDSFIIFDIKTVDKIIDGSMMVNIKTNNQEDQDNNDKSVKIIKGGEWRDVKDALREGTQEKATPEEIAEYNKLAKLYNAQEPKKTIIKQKDLERMKYLYSKMDLQQKKKSEPFPNVVPPPPPPPPAPETGFIDVNGETLFYVKFIPTEYYNKKGYKVDENGKTINGNIQVNASDVLPGQYITKVYQNDKVVAEFKDNGSENIPPPPPPPAAPKSPLEHVKDIAKKGASFYNEGTSITSDEAIKLLKANPKLNLETIKSSSSHPKVYITKAPITDKN